MTPKGGIRPHKRFTTQANKAEVLFVDLISTHLSANGRAGIVVPNGIISATNDSAYKNLRKQIVKDGLVAVISLPSGIFLPYSPVKTSILIFDKVVSKKTDSILFLKVENDGYDLGAQRIPINKNDLPNTLRSLNSYKIAVESGEDFDAENQEVDFLVVEKKTILENREVTLSENRYKKSDVVNSEYELVKLSELLDYEQPTKYIVESVNYNDSYKTPVLTAGKTFIKGYTNEDDGIFNKLPVIIFDDFTTATQFVKFPFKVKSSAMKILKLKDEKRANIQFLYRAIQNVKIDSSEHRRYWIALYSQLEIPLPSLSEQERIVDEIDGYQKEIEGFKKDIVDKEKQIQDLIAKVWGEE
jgi:type I restriction enzyme M protein